ncbi:uncharacterized protein LACBIDRAFT_327976 [Laccaria bicolor S238N-H82]|uniref:Predicted protein n=1 Tax=Laccaria bicolor (strain S238N-H82 / ATCC MYA-4686) TaxID=486041 RepID=B0DDF0_LACBS|nr:uncharacterized protein LACBIDRAFT_327976 [Laccaria bicolor S238N-H82]EDR07463.1 predicted protein [Laccaria bicolor S238N-H82]|eukprot:XP_001881855.1 predicted protein [Laccaria bicolor S238N-H82]
MSHKGVVGVEFAVAIGENFIIKQSPPTPGQIVRLAGSKSFYPRAKHEFTQCPRSSLDDCHVQTLPSQGQSAKLLSDQGSLHNEKAQLANTLWAAHPAIPWVIRVEFPVAACPDGENFIIEQAVFSNASTNRSSSAIGTHHESRSPGRFRPFPPKGKARICSMSKVQTHPTKGKERICSVSKDDVTPSFSHNEKAQLANRIGCPIPRRKEWRPVSISRL